MNRVSRVVVLMGAAALMAPRAATAAPEQVRISATEDPSTSMGIAWTTVSGPAETTVKYGTTKGALTQTKKGKAQKVSAAIGSVSEVTLTGLSPDTVYHYRVGGTVGGFSGDHAFRTAPAPSPQCGAFRFAVFGDSRAESWQGDKGSSDAWKTQYQAAFKQSPDFILHGGDIVHDGDSDKQWYNHLKATAAISSQVPIMYTIGNHDTGPGQGESAHFNQVLHLPRADKALGGSGTEDYYFFTWGNAIFVSLSTESFSGGSIKFKNQADWMDKVLTQNPKRWKFVSLHRPIYTHRIDIFSLDLGHPPDEAGQNAALVPVLTKHHVDVVFQSHNHFYERYAPSSCSDGASKQPCPVASYDQGTVHITTGGAGAFPLWCVLPTICPGPTGKVRLTASSDHHWLLLDLKDHTLSMKAINIAGKTIDAFTIQKPVPSPDPCAAPPDAGPPDAAAPDAALPGDGPRIQADTTPGGQDIGGSVDISAPAPDARPDSAATDGCSCRVQAAASPADPGLSLALVLLLLMRARARWSRRSGV